MFTYSNWQQMCAYLAQRRCLRADELLDNLQADDWLVIKHDVETNVPKALRMAQIEKQHGIRATYYVQSYLLADNAETLQQIAALGHEVTYHYDVLDANGGNMVAAQREFAATLKDFAALNLPVKTVCPHGNPLMQRHGWDSNKDFFRSAEVAQKYPNILDVVVQLPTLLAYYDYYSDAGYAWQRIVNVSDNDRHNHGDVPVTQQQLLQATEAKVSIVSTHPHRWENNWLQAVYRKSVFHSLRFLARTLATVPVLKWLMSKFYYLAKKV